jgi:hypothetical protein
MYEINISGTNYPLKFGIGFLRDINKRVQIPVDGAPNVKNNVGLRFAVGQIMDGSVEDLLDIIYLANKTENPRITMQALEAWVDDEDTDIETAFDDIMDFLRKANATKKEVAALEIAAAKREAEE